MEILGNSHRAAEKLIETATGAWKSQTLASAIEIGLFDFIGSDHKSEEDIRQGLELKGARVEDFLNALVGMGHLLKNKETLKYSNNEENLKYCVKSSPWYIGDALFTRGNVMQITSFKNLTAYLKTNDLGPKLADWNVMYDAAPGEAKKFASYMESTIKLLKDALPEKISDVWKSINSFADIGGGSGYITI